MDAMSGPRKIGVVRWHCVPQPDCGMYLISAAVKTSKTSGRGAQTQIRFDVWQRGNQVVMLRAAISTLIGRLDRRQ